MSSAKAMTCRASAPKRFSALFIFLEFAGSYPDIIGKLLWLMPSASRRAFNRIPMSINVTAASLRLRCIMVATLELMWL